MPNFEGLGQKKPNHGYTQFDGHSIQNGGAKRHKALQRIMKLSVAPNGTHFNFQKFHFD